MVNSGNREVKSSHDVLKALLRAKNDAENRLNEISAEIKFLELKSITHAQKTEDIKRLQEEEVKAGKVWTEIHGAILEHHPISHQEVALKILHLTNSLCLTHDNDRAISALKDCALVLYQLECDQENSPAL